MKQLILILVTTALFNLVSAQKSASSRISNCSTPSTPPFIAWSHSLGDEPTTSVCENSTGGYVTVTEATVNINNESWGFTTLRMFDRYGKSTYPAAGSIVDYSYVRAQQIRQTADGGYVFAGYTDSSGTDADYRVVKITNTGVIQWQKTYGGSLKDKAFSIKQTTDGGYIVGGISESTDGDVTVTQQGMWILKLDASGNIQFQRSISGYVYPTGVFEHFNDCDVIQIPGGNYVVAGGTTSVVHGNSSDFSITMLDGSGNMVWQQLYGTNANDRAHSIKQTSDGGYIVGGSIFGYGGDVPGPPSGDLDSWIIKLNSAGNMEWQKASYTNGSDETLCITETSDGGYLAGGYIPLNFYRQPNLFKLDNTGTVQWTINNGTIASGFDGIYSVIETLLGDYLISGCRSGNGYDAKLTYQSFIEVIGDSMLCPGATVLLKAHGSNNYLWSTGATTQNITVSTDGTYTVVCDPYCISEPVTVSHWPISTANAGPDQDNCSTSTILAANDPVIGTGQWSVISGNAIFADPTQYNSSVSGLNNGLNRLKWKISTAECSTVDSVDIYSGASPVIANNPTAQLFICTGANAVINSSAAGSYPATSILWQEKTGAGSFIDLANGGVYNGVTTGSLGLTAVPVSINGNQYRLVATNFCGTTTSSVATINVSGTPPKDLYRSKQTGNWDVTSTWEKWSGCGWIPATVTPTSADSIVTILHSVTLSSTKTIDQVTVNSGGTLILSNNTVTLNDDIGEDLVINGTLSWTNNSTINGNGSMVIGTTGICNLGNGTNTSGNLSTTLTNNGTFNWSNNYLSGCYPFPAFNMTGGIFNNNAVFNASVGANSCAEPSFTLGGGTFTNNPTGIMNANSPGSSINISAAVFTNYGTMNANSTGKFQVNFSNSTTHPGIFNSVSSGGLRLNGGSQQYDGSSSFTGSGSIHFNGGTHTLTGAYSTQSTTVSAGTANFNMNSVGFGDVTLTTGTLSGSAAKSLNGTMIWTTNGTLAGTGSFIINSGAVCNLGNGTNTSGNLSTTLTNNGTFNWSNNYLFGCYPFPAFNMTGGIFNNNAVLNAYASANSCSSPSFAISGGTLNNNTGGVFNSNNGFVYMDVTTLNNTGTISINAGTLYSFPRTIGGTINLQGGATFANNPFSNPTGTVSFNGNAVTNNGSITLANLAFVGSSAASLSGTGSINAMTMNGSGGIILSSNHTVNNSLTLTNGKITLGNSNLLMGTSASLNGGSAPSYIVAEGTGSLRRRVNSNSTVLFPVGTSASYNPASVALTAGSTADDFTARVIPQLSSEYNASNSPTGTLLDQHVVARTWVIKEASAGNSNATITLNWNAADELSPINTAAVSLINYDGSDWQLGSYVNGTTRTIQRSGITVFREFGVADNLISPNVLWYQDADADGYGNNAVTQVSLSQPLGYVINNSDCNDNNAAIRPGVMEICGNGVDDNCDGIALECNSLALNFDGSNDVLRLNNTMGNFGTGDFTIEFKMRSASQANHYLISKRVVCGHGSFWNIQTNGGVMSLEINESGPSNIYSITAGTGLTNGQWQHIAFTRTAGVLRSYLNGVLVASVSAGNVNLNNTAFLEFATNVCNGLNGSVKYNGDIDEVRFWNIARSQAEVQANMNCPLTGIPVGLLAYYNFDNPSAVAGGNNAAQTSVTDNSGNGITGTLLNFALNGSTSNWISGMIYGTWYLDADGDGYGNPAVSQTTCLPSVGYVSNNTDCDDGNPALHLCKSFVNAKLFLQGYYTDNGLMVPVWNNQGMVGPVNNVDSITGELHHSTTPFGVAASVKGMLHTDGNVSLIYPELTGNYYLAIRHRNTIQTWSNDPISITGDDTTSYDFTDAANKAYGNNQVEVQTGKWALYTGDMNQDDFIDGNDFPAFDTDSFNGVNSEYVATDMNGDGFVDGNDFPVFDVNSFNGVSSIHP